jgi:hypothetical protein
VFLYLYRFSNRSTGTRLGGGGIRPVDNETRCLLVHSVSLKRAVWAYISLYYSYWPGSFTFPRGSVRSKSICTSIYRNTHLHYSLVLKMAAACTSQTSTTLPTSTQYNYQEKDQRQQLCGNRLARLNTLSATVHDPELVPPK